MFEPIDCHIYRSKFKTGMYVYLLEKDNFEVLPEDLKNRIGTLEFTFSMTLTESKKLVRVDSKQVMSKLNESGFFLQMPPPNTNFLDLDLNHSDGF